jgi:two-component system sensor histidine kinase BarA
MDWELAIKLAGNSREFAEDMFLRLAKELPDELIKIKKQYELYDFIALKRSLHQLHGALCYCGAPRLKTAVAELEQALMSKHYRVLPSLLTQLELEVNELLNQITCLT